MSEIETSYSGSGAFVRMIGCTFIRFGMWINNHVTYNKIIVKPRITEDGKCLVCGGVGCAEIN